MPGITPSSFLNRSKLGIAFFGFWLLLCLLRYKPAVNKYFNGSTIALFAKNTVDSYPFSQISSSMQRKSSFNSYHIMYRSEELVSAASNRYRITVQVANRAKRRRYEELENFDDPTMKPVIRAIIEMSDELTQPEIIGD